MVDDKRLGTLQEEIKLLKGEVKHSLASVRDYLLNSELPSAELSNLGLDQGEQRITMKNLDHARAAASEMASELTSEVPDNVATASPEDEDLISVEPPLDEESAAPEDTMSQETTTDSPEDTAFSEEEEGGRKKTPNYPQRQQPLEEASLDEEAPVSFDRPAPEDDGPNTPPVNMLANLITWVARAKREIGYDQLPIFLEVYGLSGHLSSEMKDIILHFAEITTERPDAPGSADIWSQAMLSLHGILMGGDAPLHPAIPTWTHPAEEPADEKEEPVEEDSPPAPVKLKLVFPDGKGKEKEFCLDLAPEDNGHKRPQVLERKVI